MLSQLLLLFGFFSLILVLVYWLNRAVVLFDQLISDGQSALVFLEFTALSLPNVIRLVLPIGAFASAVYVANRLISESEMVVMQATGFSSFRLARPVLVFGLCVAVMLAILTNALVPMSLSRLAERSSEVSQNLVAQLLNPGEFQHPAPGATVYIRDITDGGELQGVLIVDARAETETRTYSADRAFLVRQEGSPKLVMFDGQSQVLTHSTNALSITQFADFAFDIGSFLTEPKTRAPSIKELSTFELLRPTDLPARQAGLRAYEGHNRIAQPLLCVVTALVGFATLLLGSFSRFGVWRQIIGAVFILILIKTVEGAITEVVRSDPTLWALTYLPALLGLVVSIVLLQLAQKPSLIKRRAST